MELPPGREKVVGLCEAERLVADWMDLFSIRTRVNSSLAYVPLPNSRRFSSVPGSTTRDEAQLDTLSISFRLAAGLASRLAAGLAA